MSDLLQFVSCKTERLYYDTIKLTYVANDGKKYQRNSHAYFSHLHTWICNNNSIKPWNNDFEEVERAHRWYNVPTAMLILHAYRRIPKDITNIIARLMI